MLSRGRTIYNGAGGLVPADYFASKGYPPQVGYNVADHLLDIASEPTDNILAESRTLPVPLLRSGASRLSGNGSDDDSTPKEKVDASPESGAVAEPSLPQENRPALTSRMPYRSSYASTFLTQFQVLCGREWKILRRSVSILYAVSQNSSLLQGLHVVCCTSTHSVRSWCVLWWIIFQNRHYHCGVPKPRWMSVLFGTFVGASHRNSGDMCRARGLYSPSPP